MLIVQALLALVFRSAGKILNTAFGWATVMLFGKVSQSRETYLSLLLLASVFWLIVLLVCAFPSLLKVFLPFLPQSEPGSAGWVRPVALAVGLLLPLGIGLAALWLLAPEDRPRGLVERVKAAPRGYAYTVGLVSMLLMITVVAPVVKLRDVGRRWTSQHIPVIVEPDYYRPVVADIERALQSNSVSTRREQPNWIVRVPTQVVALCGRGLTNQHVVQELTVLRADHVELLLHPSDLVIRGCELDAAHARAVVLESLSLSQAHLTWDKEANELEDRMRAIWWEARERGGREAALAGLERLRAVERDLRSVNVVYDEWEVLYRTRLVVERCLLSAAAGIGDESEQRTDTNGRAPLAASASAAGSS